MKKIGIVFFALCLTATVFAGGGQDGSVSGGQAPRRYAVGETGPAGGLVFYDKGTSDGGWQYLEVAPTDVQGVHQFGQANLPIVATGIEVGSGKQNTETLLSRTGEGNYAIQNSRKYSLGGYTDWFLPSKDELNLLYQNVKQAGLGQFTDDWYWTSSQVTATTAWAQSFQDGFAYDKNANILECRVRVIRVF